MSTRGLAPTAWILYALIALVPVALYRGTTEVFEFPKVELLVTCALALVASPLAREIALVRKGPGTWLRGIPDRLTKSARRDPLGAAIALFLLSAVLSTVASIHPEASLFGAHASEAGLKTAFATGAVYFASRSRGRDPRHPDRLARAAVIGLTIALFYAGMQLLGLDPFPWTRSATLGGIRRVPGTLGHANHLGAYIAMCLPLLAWLTTQERFRRLRLFWIALGGASLTVMAATLSRGAWVACAAGIVVYAFFAWRARPKRVKTGGRRLVLAGIVLAIAAFLVPLFTPFRPELLHRLREITDVSAPSTQSRVHLWRAGIGMFQDRPAFGVGTDAYLTAFPRYRTPAYWEIEWNGRSAKAHNELIQVAATQGILGFLAALLVVLFAGRYVFRLSRHRDTAVRGAAAAAGGALAAFAVQDLVSFTVAATGVLAAALAGWISGTRAATLVAAPGEAEDRPPLDSGSKRVAAVVVSLAWVVLVLLPWFADMAAARGIGAALTSTARVENLERALALAPWDTRNALELGRSLLARAFAEPDPARKRALLSEAQSTFERVTRLSFRDGEARALLARTMASRWTADSTTTTLARIRAEFDRALAVEPRNANVMELAAQGYLEMGRTAEARDMALRSARLFPDFALPLADIGVAALLEDRPQAAVDTLTLALRKNWHGEEGAAMAAKSNYVAALREVRLREAMNRKEQP